VALAHHHQLRGLAAAKVRLDAVEAGLRGDNRGGWHRVHLGWSRVRIRAACGLLAPSSQHRKPERRLERVGGLVSRVVRRAS